MVGQANVRMRPIIYTVKLTSTKREDGVTVGAPSDIVNGAVAQSI